MEFSLAPHHLANPIHEEGSHRCLTGPGGDDDDDDDDDVRAHIFTSARSLGDLLNPSSDYASAAITRAALGESRRVRVDSAFQSRPWASCSGDRATVLIKPLLFKKKSQ